LWSSSRTLLNSEWLAEGEAIGDLWRRASSNSLLVPANDVKRKVMDFHVVVQEEEDSEELDQANLAKKVRKKSFQYLLRLPLTTNCPLDLYYP
jgi:hypothetical protein